MRSRVDGEGAFVVEGRRVSPGDIELIQGVADEYWERGLPAIAGEVCRLWCWRVFGEYAWRQCSVLLLELHRRGEVSVPSGRRACRLGGTPREMLRMEIDTSLVEGGLKELGPVELRVVSGGQQEQQWDFLMEEHHYLGCRRVIGEHLKYLGFLGDRVVVAMLWGAAALKLAARDRLLGWSGNERKPGLERIAANYRLLRLPWVRVPNLASHTLGAVARRISDDWFERYCHGLDLLETFVDPGRFDGACYRAANWVCVGLTRGSGRRGPRYHYHGQRKLILLYGVSRRFRRMLARSPPRLSDEKQITIRPDSRQTRSSPRRPLGQPTGREESMDRHDAPPPSARTPGIELSEQDTNIVAEKLGEHTERYSDVFPRQSLWGHAKAYVSVLFREIGRKNAERVVLFGGMPTPVRTAQHFLTGAKWEAGAVVVRHQQHVAETLGDAEGVLIVDESGIVKKGSESVGVTRQYTGSVGKVENSQVGVFLAYSSTQGSTLIEGRLYMPEGWFSSEQREARWERCYVPEDLEYKAKHEIGLELVRDVVARGQLPARVVLADEEYGKRPAFLDGVVDLGLHYFCEIPKSIRVWLERPRTQEYKVSRGPNKGKRRLRITAGEPEPERVDRLVAQGDFDFRLVTIKEGTKGPIDAEVARVRVVEVRQELPGREVWLVVRRNPDTGELKYYLCSLSAETPFEETVKLCGMRWPIETCFQESKSQLGMDHYEVRSWTGWHRHMALVMLAHHLLVLVRNGLQKKTLR